jgi:pyruvate dehydrogenase E1 component alpha subunit
MQQSRDDLLAAYRSMRLMRAFDERMRVEFATGGVPGFVHLYVGQEASAAGVCANLTERDVLHSTHRAHGPALARGADPTAVAKEIYCRGDGLCRGRGGSAHLHDRKHGLSGANSGVGSGAALACGTALAMRNLGTDGVAAALIGDGAVNQGVVSEALNLSSIWTLPVIFVFENNGYAESTAADYAIAGKDIARRAAAFDMPGEIVDGHDYFAVYAAVREAVEHARAGKGPSLIELKMRRYYGHFEGDAQTYRPPGEVDDYRAHRDCLKRFRDQVTSAGLLDDAQLDTVDAEVAAVIDDAYARAIAAPLPDAGDLARDIYVSEL